METNFDAESFDFEEILKQIRNKIEKPNILICGATGVGKSSFVNDVFHENVAKVGSGEPVTRGLQKYESKNSYVVLYDSEGYEIGNEKQSYFKEEIIGKIDEFKSYYPDDMTKHIHEVWYFISAANKRVTDTDIEFIQEIQERNIPIAVVITQIDSVDEEELNGITSEVKSNFPNIRYFTVCVTDDKEIEMAIEPYNKKKELLEWAINNLDDLLKEGFITSMRDLETTKKYVESKIIPRYMATAVGAAAVPIPFSDAITLTGVQLAMTMNIVNLYGLDKLKGGVTSLINSVILSQIGKTAAKTITATALKLIPGLGTAIGATINSTVAGMLTKALGIAISELSYKYSKAVLEGKDVKFEDFFKADVLKQAIGMLYAGMK